MGLDALLARLEGNVVTPATADMPLAVTPKPAPIQACTAVTSVTAQNDDPAAYEIFEQEAWEERAAIMEYDGGMTRQEAEAAAFEGCKIQPGRKQ